MCKDKTPLKVESNIKDGEVISRLPGGYFSVLVEGRLVDAFDDTRMAYPGMKGSVTRLMTGVWRIV